MRCSVVALTAQGMCAGGLAEPLLHAQGLMVGFTCVPGEGKAVPQCRLLSQLIAQEPEQLRSFRGADAWAEAG